MIVLPAENSGSRAVGASVFAEWLSPKDSTLGEARVAVRIERGRSEIIVPLALRFPSIWTRLRYTVDPERADAGIFGRIQSTLPLARIAEHVFTVRTDLAGRPRPGAPVTVYARAEHPVTKKAVKAVAWNAVLAVGKKSIKPNDVTALDAEFSAFTFAVPEDAESLEVLVTGSSGDFAQDARVEVQIEEKPAVKVQTDKPIYQPGQTIHFRALVHDARGKAAAGAKVALHIDDPENERALTRELTASRFGVVQADYALPERAVPGVYRMRVRMDDDEIGHHAVQVKRYELPAFRVLAKSEKSAYLAGEKAYAVVSGEYLFGKPVPRGAVKIVRTENPHWNRETRKYESNEKTVAEGVAGEDGKFRAEVPAPIDPEREGRYEDLHFAAYVKDPSSGRSEQRRFDVRISKEPVHVYLHPGLGGGSLPFAAYVSTYRADGSPVPASVEIVSDGKTEQVQTNRYGVGKVYLRPRESGELKLRAVTAEGGAGTLTEPWLAYQGRAWRMTAQRTIHRVGEAVTLRLTAPASAAEGETVMVHAIAGGRRVASRVVQMRGRTGEVVFPNQREFRRVVTFLAAGASELGSCNTIFPDGSDLAMEVKTDKTVYRPGEKATVQLKVLNADGSGEEAALGLAIVDRSVMERARTDSEFGQRPWFGCAFCADQGEFEMGGVRVNDLFHLKSWTAELDLVAEALVAGGMGGLAQNSSEDWDTPPQFASILTHEKAAREMVERYYAVTIEFPRDIATFYAAIGRVGWDFRDPWGTAYKPAFSVDGTNYVITIGSAGPDKRHGTADDFVAFTLQKQYFLPLRAMIHAALMKGGDYPATAEGFAEELKESGLLFALLRDPWGTPYRAGVSTRGIMRSIEMRSAGPDGAFGTSDDVVVETFHGTYFEKERTRIEAAVRSAVQPPQTLEAFEAVLRSAGISVESYRDAWGNRYRAASTIRSEYRDKTNTRIVGDFGQPGTVVREIVPVTQKIITFALRSRGEDGTEGTYDDFDVVRIPVIMSTESAGGDQQTPQKGELLKGTGGISGVVTDASGAVVPGTKVTLVAASGAEFETETGPDGVYHFLSVPAGVYTVRMSNTGFMLREIARVPVVEGKTTAADAELQVGSVTQMVAVEAEATLLQTSTSSMVALSAATATPRVREYFPETLLWLPEVTTDANGRAKVEVPLADSVTTWQMALFASTRDGRWVDGAGDIRAFQPFFLDFVPPAVLTEGDRVEMPVTVRNYETNAQKLGLRFEAGDWANVSGPAASSVTVRAGESANTVFAVTAVKTRDNATATITARTARGGDAIKKPLQVHPDGQKRTQIHGGMLGGGMTMLATVSQDAIRTATRGELRLYSNHASLIWESAGSIDRMPHACAEQTISAGMASFIALRFARATGIKDTKREELALRSVRDTVADLLARINGDGGVPYWPREESDPAVTAHALQFLLEARGIATVDEDVLNEMAAWLAGKQSEDGQWKVQGRDSETRSLLLTALAARALAAATNAGISVREGTLGSAYHHLARFTMEYGEPYTLAQFVLAALDTGDDALAANGVARLLAGARKERDGLYWDLRANTPFFGWGAAGRLETTGLAVSALAAWRAKHAEDKAAEAAIQGGVMFLLRNRDQWGGWFSTQATVRSMRAVADSVEGKWAVSDSSAEARIIAGGKAVKAVPLQGVDPIIVDISAYLQPGENRVEVSGRTGTLARLTVDEWVPWTKAERQANPELRMSVTFNRVAMSVGEAVRCSVRAERVGFRGYGMMMAEVGLPPGVDVDRSSLEALPVGRYEVLPDRVLFYLWPQAGGIAFDFLVSPRMRMAAKTGASTLYDYYNPEALTEVAPVQWTVQ
ncbi:MAG: carboxypeptidase regulatory-like domain-containing protein [Acidobacteria bacterium]|nr:carboxypeptidase regulatory-like domain-containing protein [Acidobacteriota bacterium]